MTADDPSWEAAACGLVEVDRQGLVTRMNARARQLTGRTDGFAGYFADLLSPAGQLFFETQIGPTLDLHGELGEKLLDLALPDGTRSPVLLTAAALPHGGITVALLPGRNRHAYESGLRSARDDARTANELNLSARTRLELIARANAALSTGLDVAGALDRFGTVLVDTIADWCLLYVLDPDRPGVMGHVAVRHRDGARTAELDRLAQLLPAHVTPDSVFGRVLAGAAPVLIPEVTPEILRAGSSSAELMGLVTTLGTRSIIVAPSYARGALTCVIVLARGGPDRRFSEEDLLDVAQLADSTGLAVDNVRLYAREHSTSVALQRALLSEPASAPGLQIATRYLTGVDENQAGGDWYDALHRPDGSTVLVIGDVMGHDIDAAIAMGQLSGIIRTTAWTAHGSPADILTAADLAGTGLGVPTITSCVVAHLTPTADGAELRWSNAGHPPPIVVRGAGGAHLLEARADPLLGVVPGRARHEHRVQLGHGDSVLLYTDGLVERRGEDLGRSMTDLAAVVGRLVGTDAERLSAAAVGVRDRGTDDVAVLVARLVPHD